jgi:hypothetical protein
MVNAADPDCTISMILHKINKEPYLQPNSTSKPSPNELRSRQTQKRDTAQKVTKSNYHRVLSIVGRSRDPISKHKIERAFAKESDPNKKSKKAHVYRMIRSLSAEDRRCLVKFLDIKLKDKCMRRISELEKRDGVDYHQIPDLILGDIQTTFFPDQNAQAVSEIEKMCWNTRNWRYLLNLRGFLLFVNGESRSTVHGSKDRIRKVMLSPITMDHSPFLMYWQDFEEMDFDAIGVLKSLVTDFGESVIFDRSISTENLLLRLTERYYEKVTRHFDFLEEFILIDPSNREQLKKYSELQISGKLREYRLTMLKLLKRLLSEQVAIVDRIYEMYSR